MLASNAKFKNAHFVSYESDKWLEFDDVNIHPGFSYFESENDPSIVVQSKLTQNLFLNVPIIQSPKHSTPESCIRMSSIGGMGFLGKEWVSITELLDAAKKVYDSKQRVGITIGTHPDDLNIIARVLDSKIPVPSIYINSRFADDKNMLNQIISANKNFGRMINIFAGPFQNTTSIFNAVSNGCVGVVIGSDNYFDDVSFPLLSLTLLTRKTLYFREKNISLIVKTSPRNLSKALAAGADAIMVDDITNGDLSIEKVMAIHLGQLRENMFRAGVSNIDALYNETFFIEKHANSHNVQ